MKRGKKKKNKDDEFIYLVCDDTVIECELTEEEKLLPEYIQATKEIHEFCKTCYIA